MKILIKNGRVIDPANNLNAITDIFVEGKIISEVGKAIKTKPDMVIDAMDKIVMPGIVDMHVHLREPGREDKETISTGTAAALKGGVTSVVAMPNTSPAMDSPGNVQILKAIIKKDARANVYICGAITKDRAGVQATDIEQLKKEGVPAISDDGNSVEREDVLLEALKNAKKSDILVILHCEDSKLSNNGVVNSGIISTRLGLRGISKESEYKRIERDIGLAEKIEARVHIAHVSCAESVELIAKAKKRGVNVTAESAPHYFSLTEDAVMDYDTNMKMKPPLRAKNDLNAIKQGLRDGTIDAIASDHAPHTENEKYIEFDRAEFGVVGLETELAVAITELIDKKILDWPGLVGKLALNPSRILGIDKGALNKNKDADIIIVSPDREWIVKKDSLISKSKNSAFLGRKLKGVVEYSICAGRIAYEAAHLLER